MTKEEFVEKFGDYLAAEGQPKKYTIPPCKLCGWAVSEVIHQAPNLIGKGGPYHEFVSDV